MLKILTCFLTSAGRYLTTMHQEQHIPLPTDKNKSRENIILVNDEQITSDAVKVANTLNKFTQTSLKSSKFLNAMLRINFDIAYQCT